MGAPAPEKMSFGPRSMMPTPSENADSAAATMFRNLSTSTKLIVLCGAFIVAIAVAIYTLVAEQQIAIDFAKKELVGVRYIEAVRGIYSRLLGVPGNEGASGPSAAAVLSSLDKAEAGLSDLWDFDRLWVALDGAKVVGTFRSWASELTVPGGGALPAGAIAAVSVRPTHRRRGIMRRLTEAEEGAMRERGEAVGILHAAEYPIYGRFGYGVGCREATWELDTRSTAFHVPITDSIDIVTPDATAAAHLAHT